MAVGPLGSGASIAQPANASWHAPCSGTRGVLFDAPAAGCRRPQPWRAKSKHGSSYENKTRRRGRPAWTRSPDDSPFRRASRSRKTCLLLPGTRQQTALLRRRDGNRDRVIGLLTERATKTLIYYLSETNQHLYYWCASCPAASSLPASRAGPVADQGCLHRLFNFLREHPIPRVSEATLLAVQPVHAASA